MNHNHNGANRECQNELAFVILRFRRVIIFVLFLFILTGCEDTDVRLAMEAGVDAVKAATLDDAEVRRLAIEVSRQSDLKHDIAPPDIDYAKRLLKLVGNHYQTEDYEFNYKVYLSFLSSHPAPEARAKRLLEIVQSPQKMDEPSAVGRIIDWVKGYLTSVFPALGN